jgi:sugar/nucleoside kinase (ribokinase family)
MFVSIGELVLDPPSAPAGQLRLDDDTTAGITMGGGGRAANFLAWAAALGEPARLITRVGEDPSGRRSVESLESGGVEVLRVTGPAPTGVMEGIRPEEIRSDWFRGARLLHLPAASIFSAPLSAASHRAVQAVREQGGLVSVDLGGAAGLGSRAAYDLTMLRPELLFATDVEARALAAPLEGLAKVPVVNLGPRGCWVFGRLVPAPPVKLVDPSGAEEAFAAAYCAAYLEGATPLEAAARALIVEIGAVKKEGARP